MKRVLAALALLVSGCASDIMAGYVGQDITDVMLDYGPPANVMELPDGRVAFQWTEEQSYTSPTTTNVYGYGNYATATTYGGTTSNWNCVYTFFAKPNPQGSHTVIGIKQPDLMCE